MTSTSIYRKNSMPNWKKQLWVLVFAAWLSCLGQTVQSPLGATPKQGGTTFRLWAPFVDSVAVKVNDREPVSMSKEDGHPQADDAVWTVDLPGAKVGDRYKYLITANGVMSAGATKGIRNGSVATWGVMQKYCAVWFVLQSHGSRSAASSTSFPDHLQLVRSESRTNCTANSAICG
jgi:hypothetical protein